MQEDLEAEGIELDEGEIDSLVKQVEHLTISRRKAVYRRDHTSYGYPETTSEVEGESSTLLPSVD